MPSTSSSRAAPAAARWPRALAWVAGSLSVALHGQVFWRLWSHVPEPIQIAARPPPQPAEPEITFVLDPPAVPPAEQPPAMAAPPSVVTNDPRRKRRLRLPEPIAPVPAAAAVTHRTTAADLKAQLANGSSLPADDWAAAARPGSGSGSGEPDGRALDLRVRAGPGGVRGAVGALAGMMGSPVRGDTEKVGDIHSAMLVNKWIGQHHGELFRGCDRKQPGETMATFVERCPPKVR